MKDNNVYDKLTELTEGLLYISETESEFSVYQVEAEEAGSVDGLMEDIAGAPAVSFKEENYTLFFEKLIAGLNTEDVVMQQLKTRYTDLFTYLQNTFNSIRVLTAGDIEQNIFIICCTEEPGCFLLHAVSVES